VNSIKYEYEYGQTRMAWLPDGKKIDDMFIRFDIIHERDRHTDRQTPHDDIGRACIALRGKKLHTVYLKLYKPNLYNSKN